ncbi:hypothetical protein WOLCODRAFT_166924 [Wolfiporia cocos MD-104 SS10]|uniref:Uncharacterized protein n=1 Tax=Wolfiporia cocos (strain MD-104) TaxID=742152 RepID=A0A2H3JFH7_WOLCO|nr:hypothetical protein WOLCODRAFT_166924 [Wolfiporia cocos MD-104 SS10]
MAVTGLTSIGGITNFWRPNSPRKSSFSSRTSSSWLREWPPTTSTSTQASRGSRPALALAPRYGAVDSIPDSDPANTTPSGHTSAATYLVSLGAVLSCVLCALVFVFVFKMRSRRRVRALQAESALAGEPNSWEKSARLQSLNGSETTLTEPNQSQLSTNLKRSSATPRSSRFSTVRTIDHPRACACPQCLSRLRGANYRIPGIPIPAQFETPPPSTFTRTTGTGGGSGSSPRSESGTRRASFPHVYSPHTPSPLVDENAYRHASIFSEPSPPLPPTEHEWQLTHGTGTSTATVSTLSPASLTQDSPLSSLGTSLAREMSVLPETPPALERERGARVSLTSGFASIDDVDVVAGEMETMSLELKLSKPVEKDLASSNVWLSDADWVYSEEAAPALTLMNGTSSDFDVKMDVVPLSTPAPDPDASLCLT